MRKEKFLTTVSTKQNENGGMMVKKRFAEVKKKLVPAVSGSMMAVMLMSSTCSVSYTHLDVYKRQVKRSIIKES